MKIFAICKRYYTNSDLCKDKFGRLFHIPVQLARLNCQVCVVALDYRSNVSSVHSHSGVDFFSIACKPSRMASAYSEIKSHIGEFGPDVIWASGDSHIGFLAMKLAQSIGALSVFDVYDYYPAFRGNYIPGMRWMFWNAVAQSDMVTCVSEPLLDVLSERNPHTFLLENGVDPAVFRPLDKLASRVELCLPADANIVGFFGSMARNKGPLLVNACKELVNTFPKLILLAAGGVDRVNVGHSWIRHVGKVGQSQVPLLISASDVVAVPLMDELQNKYSGSCKIPEYLACQKPIVATRVSGHEEIFRESPKSLCGLNVSDMANALACQLTEPEVVPFPVALSWSCLAQKLLTRIGQVLPASN